MRRRYERNEPYPYGWQCVWCDIIITGAMPVIAPFRDRANHQFTGGHDFKLDSDRFFIGEAEARHG